MKALFSSYDAILSLERLAKVGATSGMRTSRLPKQGVSQSQPVSHNWKSLMRKLRYVSRAKRSMILCAVFLFNSVLN